MTGIKNFVKGMAYFGKGANLILKPRIRLFVLVPLAINIALLSLLILLGQDFLTELLTRWIPENDSWWFRPIQWLLWLLFSILAALIAYFLFITLANVLSSPFNGFLAEAIENHLGELPAPGLDLRVILRQTPGVLINECRKLLYYVLWAIPCLALFWVPVIQVIAPALWFLFMSWMLFLQYIDFPMGNHNIPFKTVRRLLRRHRSMGFGFGSMVVLMLAIPVLNFIVIPASVAGATLFWVEQVKPERTAASPIAA